MKFNRFEDIVAWQKAREICSQVYIATSNKEFARDFGLRDQSRRAAVSIMANIAEGFSRNTDKEFRQFLFVAKGSASELQSHLYIALDQHYLDKTRFDQVTAELEHLSRMLSNLIKYLARPKSNAIQRSPALPDPTTR